MAGTEAFLVDENWLKQALNPMNIFSNRKGKAAETFNILRGLKFKRSEDADFDDAPGKDKTMCIVDSGIAFNSPYPAMLRPERNVELVLSFEFSKRDRDEPPFKELLKAEAWAEKRGLPFPQIKGNPVTEDPEIRECWVKRVTMEDRDFANFDIFDDADKPYSTFEFQYKKRTFDRLKEMMKFNTLLNMDLIKEKIAYQVALRKNNPHLLI
ncbi:cytosolic phospholipase A2-like [Dendronephthya gigantea]|uniref:cytosolic phospholipase A2-like n=1 Tax=Dendronephthya gigantea TaxID=151771 RepID=UPI00106A9B39|nr:cytosolic phospholipase A2-like [Dendronephthya gigantea]